MYRDKAVMSLIALLYRHYSEYGGIFHQDDISDCSIWSRGFSNSRIDTPLNLDYGYTIPRTHIGAGNSLPTGQTVKLKIQVSISKQLTT